MLAGSEKVLEKGFEGPGKDLELYVRKSVWEPW